MNDRKSFLIVGANTDKLKSVDAELMLILNSMALKEGRPIGSSLKYRTGC